MRQAYRFKLLLAVGVSLAHVAICNFFAKDLILLMLGGNSGAKEIASEGARYLRVVSGSFLPFALTVATSTSFRDVGVTKVPLMVSVVATLVNTFFNWVLIYGNLGAPRLEVEGAAIATVIARVVEVVIFFLMLKRRAPDFKFPPRQVFAVDKRLFGQILSKSGMMLFSETAWVMSETIITALYNRRGGAETVAGMAAGWTVANIIFLVFPAIHASTNVIVGATLGAGKLEEGRQKARWVSSGAVILGIAGGLLAALSTLGIPIVFGNLTHEARIVTRGIVLVIGAYLPLWCLLNAQFAISRAGGDTLMGVWVDVGVSYVVFIPVALAISAYTSWGPVLLFGIAKLSDIPKALVAAWWLKKGRWVKNLAVRQEEPLPLENT
jgi:Na+-driven multidrug efflux pump